MAYGYKPQDLVQITAGDVVDILHGIRDRLNLEVKILFNAAEMSGMLATGKYRRSHSDAQQTRYSDKVREKIAELDKLDMASGKIKTLNG